jgi:predicted phage terminase large subunit-like protein
VTTADDLENYVSSLPTDELRRMLPPPGVKTDNLPPKTLLAILLYRNRVRGSLLEWAHQALADQGFTPARHHRLILQKLEEVERGTCPRLMIFAPPGSAKSTYGSVLFPAWYFAKHPTDAVIASSNTQNLAESFGRKVRNLLDEFSASLGVSLAEDSQAAGRWNTNKDGTYLAAGVGGKIAGRRADLAIIDDPIGSAKEAYNPTTRDGIFQWYTDDLYTRLKPNARIVLINCLTGDTPISMADGSWKRLDEIAPGDQVLAYEGGRHVARHVLNWTPQPEDDVLDIRTGSSRVRANRRHPFLVQRGQGQEWVTAGDLKEGDYLVTSSALGEFARDAGLAEEEAWALGFMFGDGWVTVRDAVQKGYKGRTYPRRGFVTCFAKKPADATNARALRFFEARFGAVFKEAKFGYYRTDIARVGDWLRMRGISGGAKGKRLPAWLFSEPQHIKQAFLDGIMASDGHLADKAPGRARNVVAMSNPGLVQDIRHLARGLGAPVTNINAQTVVVKPPHAKTPVESTIYRFSWVAEMPPPSEFLLKKITSISEAGREVVYDIQVEGAENFIADGLVTHNTRWHEDDLSGRLEEMAKDKTGEHWEILRLPAIPYEDGTPDPFDRAPGEALWPEWENEDALAAKRKTVGERTWAALFQQRPRPDSGSLFDTTKFNYISESEIPAGTNFVRGYDLGATEQVGTRNPDWSVGVKMGKAPNGMTVVANVRRMRGRPDQVDEFLKKNATDDGKKVKIGLPQDPGQAGKSQIAYFVRLLIGYTVEASPESGDKATRASPYSSQVNNGQVLLVRGDWNKTYTDELSGFPAADKDDQVDASSRAFAMILGPRARRSRSVQVPGLYAR